MGLKAGFLALFIFVWLIGAFLGSTYEYQNTETGAGMAYSTGTATFTTGSAEVIGAATNWIGAMAGGIIKCDADGIWYMVASVNSTTNLTLTALYSQAGGAGQAYTMQAVAGWAGTGTGGYDVSPINKLEYLMDVSNVVQRIEILSAIPFISPNGDYFSTVWDVLTWQWPFMDDYQMFYWIFLAPFVLMGVLSVILLVYGILTGNLSF
jgi:hypothetical protein